MLGILLGKRLLTPSTPPPPWRTPGHNSCSARCGDSTSTEARWTSRDAKAGGRRPGPSQRRMATSAARPPRTPTNAPAASCRRVPPLAPSTLDHILASASVSGTNTSYAYELPHLPATPRSARAPTSPRPRPTSNRRRHRLDSRSVSVDHAGGRWAWNLGTAATVLRDWDTALGRTGARYPPGDVGKEGFCVGRPARFIRSTSGRPTGWRN